VARAVYTTALDLGLRTSLGGHILRLAPPFNLDEALLDEGVRLLGKAIEQVVAA
jgi:4-aminobutyrate aminotransferase/(S)-3-amino-2-methylpropionate transaminase